MAKTIKAPILTAQGDKTGRECAFSVGEAAHPDHLAYLGVKAHLAAQRQGTHQTKARAYVRGSTRKLRKQKGTGNARVGSKKSPIFRGGGRAFGPSSRDYTIKLNKKTKHLARRVALVEKLADKNLLVVEDFSFEAPKTKRYRQFLVDLSVQDKKSLLVTDGTSEHLFLSSRNLPLAEVLAINFLSTHAVLRSERIIFLESTISGLEKMLL